MRYPSTMYSLDQDNEWTQGTIQAEQTKEVTKMEATFEQILSRLKLANNLQQKIPTALLFFLLACLPSD